MLKKISRRKFIQAGILCFNCGAVLFSGPSKRIADKGGPPKPTGLNRFLVRIKLNGGWDTSLCFDPWLSEKRPHERDLFLEYRSADVKRVADIFLGPAALPLAKYANDMVVINGVIMSKLDQGHPPALSYIDTGSNRGASPSFSVQLAMTSDEGPYGIITNDILVNSKKMVKTVTVNEIQNSRRDVIISPLILDLVKNGSSSPFVDAQRALVDRGYLTKNINDMLEKNFPEASLFQIVASCFTNEASFFADLKLTEQLDTHVSHAGKHMAELRKQFDSIAAGIEIFKKIPYGGNGRSLYDHTTFLLSSEFSRAPWLNAIGGKDHNPLNNSMVLIGRGIQGGKTIGRSKLVSRTISPFGFSYQIGHPIDFLTGQVLEHSSDNSEIFIKPENVFKTVAKLMGGEEYYFNEVYGQYKGIPGLLMNLL